MVQDLVLPMGMVLQLPAPGMQHSEEAGPVATDVLGVLAKLFHGVRRSREERRVANPLARADEVAQFCRDGVGHHEVMARHHPPHLPLQPEVRLVVLTLWAVAISAGAIDLMVESALLASVNDGSVLLGAAENDGGDHLPVLGGHGIRRPESATVYHVSCQGEIEPLRNLYPNRLHFDAQFTPIEIISPLLQMWMPAECLGKGTCESIIFAKKPVFTRVKAFCVKEILRKLKGLHLLPLLTTVKARCRYSMSLPRAGHSIKYSKLTAPAHGSQGIRNTST